jgi:hypothetical protein
MGISTSIVMVAIGAILRFATNVHSSSFNIQTVGVILMIVGIVGFLVSLLFWSSWGGFGGWAGFRNRRTTYNDPGYNRGYPPHPRDGRTVVEEDERRW